jgi:hypothetical protein
MGESPHVLGIPAGTPEPPQGATVMTAFKFLPSGLVFDRPINLIVHYDPELLPQGKTPVLAYYNENSKQWEEVETAGYIAGGVEVPNAVTGSISHFSNYALIAK